MPRRREVPKREILPDPKFGNVELSKFMNVIMEGGKKAVAERIIYGALEQIEKKNPARTRWKPSRCHQQRQADGRGEVPPRGWCELPGARGSAPRPPLALSMRWIKEAARKRGEKSMAQRLANELLEATEGRGGAMKKRDEVHRMAEANKAFSHFRF
jgi:small subunit ribosomal protein S7